MKKLLLIPLLLICIGLKAQSIDGSYDSQDGSDALRLSLTNNTTPTGQIHCSMEGQIVISGLLSDYIVYGTSEAKLKLVKDGMTYYAVYVSSGDPKINGNMNGKETIFQFTLLPGSSSFEVKWTNQSIYNYLGNHTQFSIHPSKQNTYNK